MAKHFYWVDLEMTGLNEKKDKILEVAVVITDYDFNTVATFENTIFQPPEVLNSMNKWSKKHHAESGLTDRVPNGIPLEQAELEMLRLANTYFGTKEDVVLAGNSVGNDKRFIEEYMPLFSKRLHYRVIDVSSFKEIFREKYGVQYKKKNKHRALDDIYESIEELKTYLSFVTLTGTQK